MITEKFSRSAGSVKSSEHDLGVARHYDDVTDWFYMAHWHPRHIHFGLFEPNEAPLLGDSDFATRLDKAVSAMVDAVVAPAHITEQDAVADIACGIGGTAMHLAKEFGCRVTGLNICRRQIEVGRDLVRSEALQDLVEFRFSDCAKSIDLPDSSVDVAVCIEAGCHMSDRSQLIAECARILKPGGLLCIQDWMASDEITREQYKDQIQPICDSWHMQSLETPNGYTEILRTAGFEITEFADLGEACLPNAEIMKEHCRGMRWDRIAGHLPERMIPWLDRFDKLSSAWLVGHFQLQRIAALKPRKE